MQQKRYVRGSELTLATGSRQEIEILQGEPRKANFHGIRASGRIRADNVSADNEAHGLIVIFCKNEDFDVSEGMVDGASDLESLSEQIVAVMPWAVFGGSTNPVGGGTFFDFEIAPKSSRTCPKGQHLSLAVYSMAESAKSVIITNMLLSCFETIT